jgi:site-specific recombinase XerD
MLRASGGKLRVTQAFLGHADLKTISIYTLVRPAELAAAANTIGRPGRCGVLPAEQISPP